MIDLAPPQPLWLPARPAIIHAHQGDLDALKALEREKGIRAMLPGMVPVVANAAAARTWTFVGYCASDTDTLNWASLSAGSIQAGDLGIYIDLTPTNTAVTPSGFTNRISTQVDGGGTGTGMLSDKKLTGSEGSIAGMNAGTESKIGLVFRPSTPFTNIVPSTPTSQHTAGNPGSQSISPSGETSAVIVIGIAGSMGGLDAAFSTTTPAFDTTIDSPDLDLRVGIKIYNSSPQNHTIDMNDLGPNNWLAGIYYKAT
jgi:hypothetical protein